MKLEKIEKKKIVPIAGMTKRQVSFQLSFIRY